MERQPLTVTHDAAVYEGTEDTKAVQAQLIREETDWLLRERIAKDVASELSHRQEMQDKLSRMPAIVRSANTSSMTSVDLTMLRPQVHTPLLEFCKHRNPATHNNQR
jgi:hypothetical protein